jgi:NAD(P)-dependent dehydrogenase (short-subunit alcohol dehydrogenase family)
MNRRESVDGIESTFALNHLAPFLLTNLLLDIVRRSEPARIINVSSSGHRFPRITERGSAVAPGMVSRVPGVSPLEAGQSAVHTSSRAGCRKQRHGQRRRSGLVATNIGTDNPWFWTMLKPALDTILKLRCVDPGEGARTIVYLATSPEVEHVTGRYFANERVEPSSADSQDVEAARWLWQASEALTGLAT